jgi:hypothetical protein
MNWKIAFLSLLIFMSIRLILSPWWPITYITVIVAIVGSLIVGFIERDRDESKNN